MTLGGVVVKGVPVDFNLTVKGKEYNLLGKVDVGFLHYLFLAHVFLFYPDHTDQQ